MIGTETTVSLKGRKLMLVDDETDFVQTTELLLTEHTGAEVSSFTSPATAISMFDAVNPECLITDMVMPGYNGIELIKILTKRRPDLPCILVTGNAFDPVKMSTTKLQQLREVLFKPISWTRLATSIEAALASKPDDSDTKGFYEPVGRW